jgi:hypothetical protein
MMQTDVSSAYLTSSGVVYANRTRVRQLTIIPNGTAGSVILYDNATTNSGNVLWRVTTGTNTAPIVVQIPAEGFLATNGVYAALSNMTSVTVVYG